MEHNVTLDEIASAGRKNKEILAHLQGSSIPVEKLIQYNQDIDALLWKMAAIVSKGEK